MGDEEKEIFGNELHGILFRVFGGAAALLTEDDRRNFLNDLGSIGKDDVLSRRLREHWKLSPAQLGNAMREMLPDDYCAYSLKALKELLPDLAAGIALSTIRRVDNPHIFRTWDMLPVFDGEECPIEVRNPVVHRVMTELRRVVNAVIARYGKPDRICIELGRDLKNTNKERERLTRQNREREKERARIAKKILEETGIANPSRNDILKVMLAEECGFECPYTGIRFNMHDLLEGKNIHIEHILPFSRSFDDSFRNKTLCEASANARKGNRAPAEAFSGEEYAAILQRVKHFSGPYAEIKRSLFMQKDVDTEDFLSRNLNDTRYASRLAVQYLSMLYGGVVDENGRQRIFAVAGGCTALLRRAWGGNYLLGEGEKVRDDHRHHAVDALTIAITTPDLIKKVAAMTPEKRRELRETRRPFIDNTLFQQASEALAACTVSHHTVNKIRGAFHKETIYSRDFSSGNCIRHSRVALEKLSGKDVAKIVDSQIRKLVYEKLGRTPEDGNISDKELQIFKEPENLPVLTDRRGNPVNTVKYVRVEQHVNARTIGSGDRRREVANGANYLLAIWAKLNEQREEVSWEGKIVTLLDAALLKQKGQPLFNRDRPGMKFKFTLKKGDIVSIDKDGKTQLCIIRGISLPQFYLVPVCDARKVQALKDAKVWFTPTLSAAFSWKMQKFEMNLFGELRRAND